MRKTFAVAGALATLLAIAACSDQSAGKPGPAPEPSAPVPAEVVADPAVQVQQTAIGAILTDQTGRTLYAFVPDKNGPGSCKDDCEATWPPYLAPQKPKADAGVDPALLTMLPREGGVAQVKYGDWPLYSYVPDVGPGDVDGQGEEDGLWWAVDSAGKLVKTMPAL